jgi:endonuclease/exonuclease/phosphatase family metal-dependent hydrolase
MKVVFVRLRGCQRRLALVVSAWLGFAACSAGPTPSSAQGATARDELKLATWNLEWLITPEALRSLTPGCTGEDAARPRGRYIPCEVAKELARTREDFTALAKYGAALDADVIALQEVDGEAAARLVFPTYRFCMTRRTAVQNTGFAIRPGIPYRCEADVVELSLRSTVRRGAHVVLYPGTRRELHVLSVHLKSGCGRKDLDDASDPDCRILAQQVPVLERWIDAQARAGRRFAVLGDFNRNLLRDRPPAKNAAGQQRALWPEIDDSDPPEADLVNAAEGEPFINCSPQQAHTGYIDYVVLSRTLGERRVPSSFQRLTYSATDAARRKLSDHCPVAVRVKLS